MSRYVKRREILLAYGGSIDDSRNQVACRNIHGWLDLFFLSMIVACSRLQHTVKYNTVQYSTVNVVSMITDTSNLRGGDSMYIITIHYESYNYTLCFPGIPILYHIQKKYRMTKYPRESITTCIYHLGTSLSLNISNTIPVKFKKISDRKSLVQ
jgi:hypothetical protein